MTPQVSWPDVWFCVGLYLGQSSSGSADGPAGSLVLLLAWVYYASLVFLFGAEFAAVYAQIHGSRATRKRPTASDVGRK
jgi:membrane protein